MSELKLIASAKLPTPFAEFMVHAYLSADGKEHLAVVLGDIVPRTVDDADITLQPASSVPPLVRVHSECLTGDALFSLRCDCGAQLRAALEKIANEGRGALLYLRQEGRGIGLGNKIRAYALQDQGADTVEANRRIGFPADARDYGLAVRLLQELGLTRIRLMTNNPAKLDALVRDGVEVVERIPLERGRNAFNTDYLDTKMTKMGHLLGAKGAA